MNADDRAFWNIRHEQGRTPWDAGGVPGRLLQWLRQHPGTGRVLIPGCGTGYEVRAFIEHGWDVLAVDCAPAAVARARAVLGPLGDRVLLADFFSCPLGPAFDVVYERAFLCSFPPERWPACVARIHRYLRPDGLWLGFFLYGQEDEPPPYPLTEADASRLIGTAFARLEDEAVHESVPVFAGRERWQVWQKRAAASKHAGCAG